MNKNITTIYVGAGYKDERVNNSNVRILIRTITDDPNSLYVDVSREHGYLIAEFVIRGGEYYLTRGGWWKDTRRGLNWNDTFLAVKTGEVRPGINRQEFAKFQQEFKHHGDWCTVLTYIDKLARTWKRYRGTPECECSVRKEARYL